MAGCGEKLHHGAKPDQSRGKKEEIVRSSRDRERGRKRVETCDDHGPKEQEGGKI